MKLLLFLAYTLITSSNITPKNIRDASLAVVDEKKTSEAVDKLNAQIEEVEHLLSQKTKTQSSQQLAKLRIRLHNIKAEAASKKIDTLIDLDKILSLESSISTYIAAIDTTKSISITGTSRKKESRKLHA